MEKTQISEEAIKLHNEARELGQKGEYDFAIAKFEEVAKLQSDWAHPYYDMAFTYLLKTDFDKALEYYKKVDEMEPKGFFTAKTAIYSLEGEKNGKFPQGLYTLYMQIEWTQENEKKMEIAKTIVQQIPDFAPAWKEYAALLDNDTDKLDAIEKGLNCDPDLETKGALLINKATVLNTKETLEQSKKILEDMVASPETTNLSLQIAKLLLGTFQ